MKLEKIIEYGLYLLVFLLPLQTRWIIKLGEIEYWTYSLYAIDILLLAILLLFAIYAFRKREFSIFSSQFSKIWYAIIILDIFIFISIFFATDKWLSLYKYSWSLLGVGLFLLIKTAKYKRIKLIGFLLFGIFLQALLGIYQFLTQTAFANKWLGLASHIPYKLGTSVIEAFDANGIGERWLRAYGGLDHPNVLGGILTIGILLLVSLLINRSLILNFKFLNTCLPAGRNARIINSKLFYYFIILLFLTALFFTFSRGAWLALVAGILFMLFIFLIKKDYFAQREILKLILAGSILLFLFFNLFSNLVTTRFENNTRLEAKSNQERIEYLSQAKNLIKSNSLFGVGLGNYTLAIAEKNPNLSKWNYQPVHNVFLLVWVEIGILGFLGFLGLLGFLGWKLLQKKEYVGLAILASLILMMMVDHWYWSLHFGVLWFFLVIGIIWVCEEA